MDSKLEKLLSAIAAHDIKLNPPASLEAVHAIEQKNGITLPEAYVAFVTTIGNGGVLIESVGGQEVELVPIEQCFMDLISKPFIYTESWVWSQDDDYDCVTDPEEKVRAAQYGHFPITGANEVGFTWELIVNGPCRGEVWGYYDGGMYRGKDVNFLDWFLDCIERGYQDHYIDPSRLIYRDMDAAIEHITNKITKKKLILRPPVSNERVLEIEQLYKITLPKDYVAFITRVGDGFTSEQKNQRREKHLDSIDSIDLTRAAMPFPFAESWIFEKSSSRKVVRNVSPNVYDIEKDIDGLWPKAQNGYITLSSKRNHSIPALEDSVILIVNGIRAGEIWVRQYDYEMDDGGYIRYNNSTFLFWLKEYLDGN